MSSETETAPRVPKTFRLPPALVQELAIRAELDDIPMTQIVEEALRLRLGMVEEGSGRPLGDDGVARRREDEPAPERAADAAVPLTVSAAPASASPQPPPAFDAELAHRLAEATGKPRSLCRMWVAQGRVEEGPDGGMRLDGRTL